MGFGEELHHAYDPKKFPTAKFIHDADMLESELEAMRPMDRLAIYDTPEIGLIINKIKERFPYIYAYHRITESIFLGNPTILITITNQARAVIYISKKSKLDKLAEREANLILFDTYKIKCAELRRLPLPIADAISIHLRPFD